MDSTVNKPGAERARLRLLDIGLALALFGLIWTPRVAALNVFVTIDEPVWLAHALDFAYGLVHYDWAMTFRLEHPGVTTMWLAVVGLLQKLPDYAQRALADPETYRQPFDRWLSDHTELTPLALLVAARWWVTLTVALTLAVTYFPLHRLLGRWMAALCLFFIAWSPMAVAFSRQLQPDGLLASLCLGTLVFFLAWMYDGQRGSDLFVAGVMMGLAWLTKIPAAMLVPTGALLIAAEWWRVMGNKTPAGEGATLEPGRPIRTLLLGYLVWGLVATVTFFALWPAMWVDPVGSFQRIFATMTEYTGGHANPNFFMGRVVVDPGPLFYPVAYLLRTTPATLIGLGAAWIAWWQRRALFAEPMVRRSVFGLVIFAAVFFGVMTGIGKKFDRYLLPAFLALEVVAALGWGALSQLVYTRLKHRTSTPSTWQVAWPALAAGIVLVLALGPLHGIFTARTYPYYMTYYNPLLGGARTAERALFVGWGEGLEQVGTWLNQQPDADNLRVISWYATGPLSYFFAGDAISVLYGSRMPWLDADYVVLYANQVQRGIPTWAAVDYFLQQQPAYTVTSQNLTLARLYDLHAIVEQLTTAMQPPIAQPVTVTWPDQQLTALHSLPVTRIASALPVALTWRGVINGAHKVSLRLISETGDLVAQQDAPLTAAMKLTLFVPPDAVPGAYTLFLMVYVSETLEPVQTTDGQALAPLLPIQITDSKGR